MTWGRVEPSTLLQRTSDPFVRYSAPPDTLALTGPYGWAVLVRWRPHGHWGGGAVVAPDAPRGAESEALQELTDLAAARGVVPEWFSTVGSRELRPPAGLQVQGEGRWAFLWTTRVDDLPPGPAGLVELDDTTDAEEIEAFGRGHNPAFEGFPGHGLASLWLGVRDATGLAAVGALHVLGSGAPHLAGIVVRTDRRGSGLGAALTAELTRAAVSRHGVATLGVSSSNAVAVSLYDRLGYAAAHHFHTRTLVPRAGGDPGPTAQL